VKLHVGSGGKRFAGWTNFDTRGDVKPDIEGDAAVLKEVTPESCTHIYASHVLEHFKHSLIVPILKNWASRLQTGGRLWISVPDIDIIARLHVENIGKITPPQFPWNALIYGGQEYPENTHYSCFNFPFIQYCLVKAGLINVRHIPYEEHLRNIPGVNDYSTCKYVNTLISLTVEAIKP